MPALRHSMRWLEHLEEWLISFLLAAMTCVTFMQVIARYIFNYSFVWALELNGVMFGWLIFIGMSYGVRVGAHIGVDAFVKSLNSGAARVVGMIAAALCVVYAVIVTVGGYQYVHKMYDVGIEMQDLPVQQWIPRLALPLGFALLATVRKAALLGDEAEEALKLRQDEPVDEVKS
jgi:C4-dicarboxylate transporter DctQ subunit